MNAVTIKRTADFPVLFSRVPLARLLDSAGPVRLNQGWKIQTITQQERTSLQLAERNLSRRHSVFSAEYIVHQLAIVGNQFKSERTPAEWEMLYADYAANLQEFPCAIFHDVNAHHRRSKTWFPKLADLVQGCIAQLAKEREDLRRIRVLLGREEPRVFERPDKDDPEAKPRSKEEIERILAKATDVRRAWKSQEIATREPIPERVLSEEERARFRKEREESLERLLASGNVG